MTCFSVVLFYHISERDHRALCCLLSHIRQGTVDLWRNNIRSTHKKLLYRVNNTHNKYIKMGTISNIAKKLLQITYLWCMLACGIRSWSGIQCSSRTFSPTLLGETDNWWHLLRYGPGGIPTYHKEVPSWVSKTKPLDVANVETTSHSRRVNKSFTNKKVWWISLVAVLNAGQHVVVRLVQVTVIVVHAKCTLSFARSVEPRHRCHSYPRMIALFIAAHAMTRSE